MYRILERVVVVAVFSVLLGCGRGRDVTPGADDGSAAFPDEIAQEAVKSPPAKPRTFHNLDVDSNGSLTLDEFIADSDAEPLSDVFEFSDRNGDGLMSLEEFRHKPREARFRRMDSDDDRHITFEEYHIGEMRSRRLGQAYAIFALLDRDQNGRVSLEEYSDRTPEAEFAKADLNEDGSICPEEFRTQLAGFNERDFEAWDRNADDLLNLDEFSRRRRVSEPWSPEGAFARLDKNGDAMLTKQEFTANRTPAEAQRRGKIFDVSDQNDDGELTLPEYRNKPPEAFFLCMDTDDSGFLSPEELRASEMSSSSPERVKAVFTLLDRDGDEKVSFEEHHSRTPEVAFTKADQDGDGNLCREEARAL